MVPQRSFLPRAVRPLMFMVVAGMTCASCTVIPGTPSGDAAGGDTEGGFIRFPETGDELIVISDAEDGELLVFGDGATAAVSRVRMSDPEVTFDARIDDEGRPTQVRYNSLLTLFVTQHDDGTFDYDLTEDGSILAFADGLSPTPVDAGEPNPFGGPAKSARAARIGALDILLCAGDQIAGTARSVCGELGHPEAGNNTGLAKELRTERRAVNAGLLICASYRALALLNDSRGDCGCSASREPPCCARIDNAQNELFAVIGTVEAIVERFALDILQNPMLGDSPKLCRAAEETESGVPCIDDSTCPDGQDCGDDLTCVPGGSGDQPSPTPATDCGDAGCRFCYLDTSFEANCPENWNGGDDGCDCGCQFVDADCMGDEVDDPTDDGGDPTGDDDTEDDGTMEEAVGVPTLAVCPAGLVTQHGEFGETLRDQTLNSFFQFSEYHGECRYVRADGVNPDRMIGVDLQWRPTSAGSPDGGCRSAESVDIVPGEGGSRLSTQRTITVNYVFSTPIIDRNEVLDELIRNAVQAGVGAACP